MFDSDEQPAGDEGMGDREFLQACLKAPEPELRIAAAKALTAKVKLIHDADREEIFLQRKKLQVEIEQLEEERDGLKREVAELKAQRQALKGKDKPARVVRGPTSGGCGLSPLPAP